MVDVLESDQWHSSQVVVTLRAGGKKPIFPPAPTRQRRNMRSRSIPLLVGITILSLAGCAGGGTETPSSADSLSTAGKSTATESMTIPQIVLSEAIPEKNQERWVLPTDVYSGRPLGTFVIDAQIVDTVQCMNANGYPDYPLHIKLFRPENTVYPWGANAPIFNERIAAEFGYRLGGETTEAFIPGVSVPERQLMPAAFGEQLDTCETQSLEKLHPEMAQYIAELEKLGTLSENPQVLAEENASIQAQLNQLRVDTQQPALVTAAEKWRECMAPLGIADLPETPWANASPEVMPPSLLNEWHWETGGMPSADEVRVATHDAQCRRSSGWFDALYEETWKVHEEFVRNHQSELTPILEDYKRQVQVATEVYKNYGAK